MRNQAPIAATAVDRISSSSDSDDDNSMSTSEGEPSQQRERGCSSAVESSILAAYLNASGSGRGAPSASLSNLVPFFSSASGRGGPHSSCLICLSRIRLSDPVWSCTSCFSLFHLPCI